MKLSINLTDKAYRLTHDTDGKREVLILGVYPQGKSINTTNAEKNVNSEKLLMEINGYFDTMHPEAQDILFSLYAAAVEITLAERSRIEMCSRITPVFTEIMNNFFHKDDVANYVESLDINYPSSVHEEYVSDGNRKIRERTYIKKEYFGLACVALICHGMAPLWTLLNSELDKSERSDIIASNNSVLQTLSQTNFINDPEWIGRLYEMVTYLVDKLEDKHKLGVKVNGSGTEALPPFILTSILMSKLPTCIIAHPPGDKNIIVSANGAVDQEIARYISTQKRYYERSETRMSDDDDKLGFLESYTTRQKISDDIYIVNDIYISNHRQLKMDLDDSIPNALVKKCLTSLNEHPFHILNKIQVTLCQWCLTRGIKIDKVTGDRRRLIMPRAMLSIGREAMFSALAVTQAALISWGFEGLAKYISASYKIKECDDLLEFIAPAPYELDNVLKSELNETHPYLKPNGGTKAALNNMAAESIKAFVLLLEDYDWELNCTPDLAEALKSKNGHFETDVYIKHDLANLIAFISR